MTPRPIHKWKTFWLGLLILAFLGWAWSRSRSQDDYVSVRTSTYTTYGIGSSPGYLLIGSTTIHPPLVPSTRRFNYGSNRLGATGRWFPSPVSTSHIDDKYYNATYHGIAHWLLTFLFFLGWSSLLLFRSHRLRRLTTQPQQQAAPTP